MIPEKAQFAVLHFAGDDGEQEFLLVPEVVVEGRLGHAHGVGDLLHGSFGIALAEEGSPRLVQNPFPAHTPWEAFGLIGLLERLLVNDHRD